MLSGTMMHFTDVSRRGREVSGSSSNSGRTPITLFGRDSELEELQRHSEIVRLASLYGSDDFNHRPPSVILLRGPSGSGKTAVVQELGSRIEDATALRTKSRPPRSFTASRIAEVLPRRERQIVFVSGKVDQFQQQLPFGPIVQALDELGAILLQRCEETQYQDCNPSEEETSEFAGSLRKIKCLLNHEGKTLVQMVPNLARFMDGCSDDGTASSGGSDVNRVTRDLPALETEKCSEKVMTERLICLAVQSFVRLFVHIHPFVWFVDDLQWADDSSLRLLQALVVDHKLAHVMFVLGYRDGSNEATRPLHASDGVDRDELACFWKCCQHKIDMPLENLALDVVVDWFAHLLSADPLVVRPLAELVHSKTEGNPYFCLNYLEFLQRKQALRFRYHSQTWEWSLSDIADPPRQRQSGSGASAAAVIRPNTKHLSLEEVVVMQIASLPPLVQQLLQISACLGYYFDETLLKRLLQTCDSLLLMGFSQMTALCNMSYQEDEESTCTNPQNESSEDNEEANQAYLKALYQAEEEGLIRPTRDPRIYQFTHDRVQQTVYQAMANEKEVALLHLRIGKYIQEMDDDQYLLDAADQLNRGSLLLVHEMERLELIELNLEVSPLASKRGGINLMTDYLEKAVSLVKERDWTRSYNLALEVHTRSAEAEATRGRFDKCDARISTVLQYAKSPDDTIRARFVRLQILGTQGHIRLALLESRKLLAELGERLPASNRVSLLLEFKRARRLVQCKTDADLESLPPITDSKLLWIAKILNTASLFAWDFDPTCASILFMRLFSHSLVNGCCESTPYGYASYGTFAANMGFEDEGSRFADLALRVVKDKADYPTAALVVYQNLNHLKHTFRDGLKPLLATHKLGLEIGNLHIVALGFTAYTMIYHLCGQPLGPLADCHRNFGSQLHLCGQEVSLAYTLPSLRFALNLLGETDNPLLLSLDACKEQLDFCKGLNLYESAASQTCRHYLQAFSAYILGDLELAGDALHRTKLAKLPVSHVSNIFHSFIDGLVNLALYRKTGKKKFRRMATRATTWIAKLAEKQPQNCTGMHLLLQAEQESATSTDKKRLRRLYLDAINNFDQAGFLHFAAIANERAGECMGRCDDDYRKQKYMCKARDLYQAWGAIVKVKSMEGKYVTRSLRTRAMPGRHSSLMNAADPMSDFLSERLSM